MCAVKTNYFMSLLALTAGPILFSVAVLLIFTLGRIYIIMHTKPDESCGSEDTNELGQRSSGETSQAQREVAGAELTELTPPSSSHHRVSTQSSSNLAAPSFFDPVWPDDDPAPVQHGAILIEDQPGTDGAAAPIDVTNLLGLVMCSCESPAESSSPPPAPLWSTTNAFCDDAATDDAPLWSTTNAFCDDAASATALQLNLDNPSAITDGCFCGPPTDDVLLDKPPVNLDNPSAITDDCFCGPPTDDVLLDKPPGLAGVLYNDPDANHGQLSERLGAFLGEQDEDASAKAPAAFVRRRGERAQLRAPLQSSSRTPPPNAGGPPMPEEDVEKREGHSAENFEEHAAIALRSQSPTNEHEPTVTSAWAEPNTSQLSPGGADSESSETPTQSISRAEQLAALTDLCSASFFTMTYLVFPSVSLTILKTLSCDTEISDASEVSYLKADMSIMCTKPNGDANEEGGLWQNYVLWEFYAYLMILICKSKRPQRLQPSSKFVFIVTCFPDPVGIPLMYFLLTYRKRNLIDPTPLAVAADVIRSEVKGAMHRDAGIVITDEIQELAHNLLFVRAIQLEHRTYAIDFHAKDYAVQKERDRQDELTYKLERHTASERMIHKQMTRLNQKLGIDPDRVSGNWKVRCQRTMPPPASYPKTQYPTECCRTGLLARLRRDSR